MTGGIATIKTILHQDEGPDIHDYKENVECVVNLALHIKDMKDFGLYIAPSLVEASIKE